MKKEIKVSKAVKEKVVMYQESIQRINKSLNTFMTGVAMTMDVDMKKYGYDPVNGCFKLNEDKETKNVKSKQGV